MPAEDALPRYRDLPGLPTDSSIRCAWGLFGESDEVGTLNLITPDLIRRAAGLVRWGTVFPLNWRQDLPDPPLLGRGAARRVEKDLDPGTDDYYDNYYPQASSQWDALRHVGHSSHGYYNGLPLEDAAALGASRLGIDRWAERGIAGRFVLLDVDRHRAAHAVPLRHDERTLVSSGELDEVLRSQGTTVERGDIVLIRFGWMAWYLRLDQARREMLATADIFAAPGLAPEEQTAEWLWDHEVAAVAADSPALEAMPFDRSTVEGFLHYRLVTFLGMAVGELFDLDALADDCASNGVYEGLLVAAPMNSPGGSGSPANALAIK
jgi:kynurenine formamidase